ncbi:phosphatidylethanolamine methyltransferase [Trichodelitschia bisporula]|uniref:Phosphatidylethanolamine N-methyltransferase n=1 Tax=Trichodelitschia bisporula TaxID=703511 RepID=A0A6G1HKW4_9PEZI|nr:phosphatidylethanolamine methyltransferase [Trichodelitschia bisporula]
MESELRERIPHSDANNKSLESPNGKKRVDFAADEETREDAKQKKTYGRTPDGTVFTVPHTHDMVSQLLSPWEPKNLSDLFILVVLAAHISLLFWLPKSWQVPILPVIFLFWRACYNAGIGILLQWQSNDRRLVLWAKKSNIFENPATGKNPHPKVYALIKSEMETKIPEDYKFEEAPVEYNTWLVFRRVVDVILMCDFISYCVFAISCAGRPEGEGIFFGLSRWTAGIVLFLFNVWVKLDAHRVVKDYAWYWGDFFYLIDQELTFDGVFEMAPHPMYSVGYAGYYGISLMAASYKVLFISIIAHAAQFAFLTLVENPHIEKTYNSPPPRRRSIQLNGDTMSEAQDSDPENSENTGNLPTAVHKLLGLHNTDFHRVTDVAILILQFYIFTFALVTPSTGFYQIFFTASAVLARLWFSLGIGFILNRQSNKKSWTRHFIKFGEDSTEAWRQWKGVYHLSMTLCYATYIAAAWKMYHLPPDWSYGMVLLRHVIGIALIALHLWTVFSIYESLGEFGWFYGDFFFDHAPKLTYSGIYRFLNNPERFLGLAGVWGFAIITWSKTIFFLAFTSHLLTLLFIQFVERPHMEKLYGETMRKDSGLSKSIRRSLPAPIRQWQQGVDRRIETAADFLEEMIEAAGPKLAAGVGHIVKDSKDLFMSYPAKINITQVANDMTGFDPADYELEVEGTPASCQAELDRRSGREGVDGQQSPAATSDYKTPLFEYGAPITVRWSAPHNHGRKDWIGLYMVSDNASREVSRVSSRGRWIATNPGEYDSARVDEGILVADAPVLSRPGRVQGEMTFAGDKLWWTTGVFEFRYHHDGKHNVMAISLPFEIRISRFDEDDVELDASGSMRGAVETALLPVVRNCLDRDPDIAPETVEEPFGGLVEREGKYAKRIVFAVQHMFGIEFAPEVVQADGNVKNLAWRICNAKKVLAPYSMSTRGRSTPTNKY